MSESLTKLHELVERIDRDYAAGEVELFELINNAKVGRVDWSVYDERSADVWYTRSVDLALLLTVIRSFLNEQ